MNKGEKSDKGNTDKKGDAESIKLSSESSGNLSLEAKPRHNATYLPQTDKLKFNHDEEMATIP